ncbi:MAG: 7-cyano-7-deazaguanine reductase [Lentisphaerae bacterium GWF2_52_8]|nr:MAG: 7-cyano-7-deazaguanine reductase [Lentisphaerae bacterium GWF2_52_8]
MKKKIVKGNQSPSSKRFARLTLLSAGKTKYPASPSKSNLESFENAFPERDYEISFNCPEFTSLCPVTNQPDFGDITINYVPDKLCIESKSLKLFLFSFRNHNSFHEEAVNSILSKIVAACRPRRAEVLGVFRPRGGIGITVRATHQSPAKKKTRKKK